MRRPLTRTPTGRTPPWRIEGTTPASPEGVAEERAAGGRRYAGVPALARRAHPEGGNGPSTAVCRSRPSSAREWGCARLWAGHGRTPATCVGCGCPSCGQGSPKELAALSTGGQLPHLFGGRSDARVWPRGARARGAARGGARSRVGPVGTTPAACGRLGTRPGADPVELGDRAGALCSRVTVSPGEPYWERSLHGDPDATVESFCCRSGPALDLRLGHGQRRAVQPRDCVAGLHGTGYAASGSSSSPPFAADSGYPAARRSTGERW